MKRPAVTNELKKEDLAKLYREFSRQKYNKYKHQFPRMRESELISKIIKEWESMDAQEKFELYNSYTNEKNISDDKSESSEEKQSPGSSKQKKKKSQSKSVSKRRKFAQSSSTPNKTGLRVFVQSSSSEKEKDQSVSSDFDRDGVKKDFQISSSSELGTKAKNTKKKITKVAKQPRTQYLKFFQFYYDKLTSQHPRWSANQISTIIKLLWKKKLSTDKTGTRSLRPVRQRKSTSGRMAFRRAFGYDGIAGYERWKQLTREARKYWNNEGSGFRSGERRAIPDRIKGPKIGIKASDSSINTVYPNQLNFLNKSVA